MKLKFKSQGSGPVLSQGFLFTVGGNIPALHHRNPPGELPSVSPPHPGMSGTLKAECLVPVCLGSSAYSPGPGLAYQPFD